MPPLHGLLAGRPSGADDDACFDGHAIIVGYGRVGGLVAAGLRELGSPVVVIEEELHLVQDLERLGMPAIYGDATYASILAAAHPKRARLVVVTLPAAGPTRTVVRDIRSLSSDVPILARAARLEEGEVLRQLGATQVVAPEQAGAVLLLDECADALNVDRAVLVESHRSGLTPGA
jgi:CPA2 family monovalent cation:H+ antiporter-2